MVTEPTPSAAPGASGTARPAVSGASAPVTTPPSGGGSAAPEPPAASVSPASSAVETPSGPPEPPGPFVPSVQPVQFVQPGVPPASGGAVTLRAIVAEPGLALTVTTGHASLDRPVQWAHVSELADPTPYLVGGELLLTAGVDLPTGAAQLRRYVRGLAGAGVAALGFGLAPVHTEVPTALVDACAEHGLPLITVPETTPFLAVSRAVSRALEEQRAAHLRSLAEAQSRVTDAALHARRPVAAVLAATIEAIGGWAVLLDGTGRPAARGGPVPALGDDVRDLALRLGRAAGPRAATAHSAGHHVELHPVGSRRTGNRVLVLGRAHPFTTPDRTVTAVAVGLLGLLDDSARTTGDQGRLLARVLLGDDLGTSAAAPTRSAELLARLLGGRAGTPVRVVRAARATGAARDTAGDRRVPPGDDVATAVRVLASPVLDISGGELCAVVPQDTGPADLEALRETTGHLGALSRPVHPGDLAAADREARLLLPRVLAAGEPLTARPAGPGVGELVDRAVADDWARATLAPLLDAEDGAELCALLRTWLAHHGGWDRTAAATGLHRNSVRHRVARAERLLGTDLSGADERARLWLALTWLP